MGIAVRAGSEVYFAEYGRDAADNLWDVLNNLFVNGTFNSNCSIYIINASNEAMDISAIIVNPITLPPPTVNGDSVVVVILLDANSTIVKW